VLWVCRPAFRQQILLLLDASEHSTQTSSRVSLGDDLWRPGRARDCWLY
jgi:hypothetical protein